MEPISASGLGHLKAHQYKSGTWTPLDLAFNPFWTRVVEFMPMWLAPNAITLLGTIIMVLTVIAGVLDAPSCDGSGLSPRVNLFTAVSIFLYQTLDAIDGKQARRTGSSSPLGQLFDHGCDALVTAIVTWNAMAAVGLSHGSAVPFLLLAECLVMFFLAQWEEFWLHTLRTNVGGLGVTEGQVALMALHVAAALLPCSFWALSLPLPLPGPLPTVLGAIVTTIAACLPGPLSLLLPVSDAQALAAAWAADGSVTIPIRTATAYTAMCVLAYVCTAFVVSVVFTRRAGWPALKQLIPSAMLLVSGVVAFCQPMRDGVGLADRHPLLLLLAYVLAQTHLTTQIIVASMAQDLFPYDSVSASVTPVLVAAAAYAGLRGSSSWQTGLLVTLASHNAAAYLFFVAAAMRQITRHLNIKAFRITPRLAAPAAPAAAAVPAAAAAAAAAAAPTPTPTPALSATSQAAEAAVAAGPVSRKGLARARASSRSTPGLGQDGGAAVAVASASGRSRSRSKSKTR